jgi:hypothetical protein
MLTHSVFTGLDLPLLETCWQGKGHNTMAAVSEPLGEGAVLEADAGPLGTPVDAGGPPDTVPDIVDGGDEGLVGGTVGDTVVNGSTGKKSRWLSCARH